MHIYISNIIYINCMHVVCFCTSHLLRLPKHCVVRVRAPVSSHRGSHNVSGWACILACACACTKGWSFGMYSVLNVDENGCISATEFVVMLGKVLKVPAGSFDSVMTIMNTDREVQYSEVSMDNVDAWRYR